MRNLIVSCLVAGQLAGCFVPTSVPKPPQNPSTSDVVLGVIGVAAGIAAVMWLSEESKECVGQCLGY